MRNFSLDLYFLSLAILASEGNIARTLGIIYNWHTGTVHMINVRVTVITFVLTAADVAGAPPVSLLALAWAWS